jgi:hypothetical protein
MTSGEDKPPAPAPSSAPPPEVFVYRTSGIAERKGKVPIWLWMTALGLTIWGIYYLIVYWNAAPPAA